MSALLLSLDCSDNQLRVASGPIATSSVWTEHTEALGTGQTASERILTVVRDLIGSPAEAGLSGIAVCVGPGAFTGLRLGVAVAQGLATALNIPCLGISSLLLHARAAMPQASFLPVALDARLSERFVAWTDPGSGCLLSPVGLVHESDVLEWLEQQSPPGLSAEAVADAALEAWHAPVAPQQALCRALAELSCMAASRGDWVDAASLAPAYVRDRVAFTEQERRAGAGGNPSAIRLSGAEP